MIFNKESEFEEALIHLLENKGWKNLGTNPKPNLLKHPTEKDLIKNWANILYDNNNSIDRLNDVPLSDGEMQQILEYVISLRTPIKLNGFLKGKYVTITRDNENDKLHYRKQISLKIFDPYEISGGQTVYQIVQQPEFSARSKILNNRRGDLMLLINGMPLIHIELKKSGIPVSQACEQIKKYAYEGVFTGIFSLIQVFVAMNPEETKYFANPGPDGKFNPDYYFHWADFDNEPINNWQDIGKSFLSIPMAHQLIGFYTIADSADGVLKVMRSYQYQAANAISDKVSKIKWNEPNHQLGGYIFHTTGSGKTMTSFKSAQLIANSNDADKVIFLTDRIELGTQSLKEYRGFAEDNESVQATENTLVLLNKLKSKAPEDTLIVTSIQKMSNIKEDSEIVSTYNLKEISKKRVVFIVDEAHRSTFGEMLMTIKDTFSNAVFFGFTGTPIYNENQKKKNTTSDIFGRELHIYSVADGIRDKNVLGFDTYKVLTFKDKDIKVAVALNTVKAKTVEEAISNPAKAKIFYEFMKKPMVGYFDEKGKYVFGIEDGIPKSQYHTSEHCDKVVEDIQSNWLDLSHNGKFHALFATSSIPEAIKYYRLLKNAMPNLKITCLFDPNIDNCDGFEFKESGLVEIISDYNSRYNMEFSLSNFAAFKKDVALRLAHKEIYKKIERTPEKQIDILIVVDQMLTGFDSKWINTLYMDKILKDAGLIQAFSRTNRLFGPEKPFGTIRYYRKPHTMERNVNEAVKLYSGNKPLKLFVEKLPYNLQKINEEFDNIKNLFEQDGIVNFEKLPEDDREKGKFVKLFNELNSYLEAAKIQGFRWNKLVYEFKVQKDSNIIELHLDETTYLILVQRYKELLGNSGSGSVEVPYDLKGYLTEIDTGLIDAEFMNSRFEKYLNLLHQEGADKSLLEAVKSELHNTFATLTKDEQKCANIFLHDIERGDIIPEKGKTLRDYITQYQYTSQNNQIHKFATYLGLDEEKLKAMIELKLTNDNINEFGRFDDLKQSVDKTKAKDFFEKLEAVKLNPVKVNMRVDKYLREFILQGELGIKMP